MSFSFYVRLPRCPTFAALADLVDDDRFTCDDVTSETLDDNACWHVYLRHAAARAVELSYEAGVFGARIMTCSSRADHELALAIVRGLAVAHDAKIEPEEGGAYTVGQLADHYGAAWVTSQVAWGPTAVAGMIDRDGNTLTMSGARRPMHIGPRFLGELRARGGDLSAQLLDAFIELQDAEGDEEYYPASVMQVTPKGSTDSYTMAVWGKNVRYIFPDVERFEVLVDGGSISIPHLRGPELAGARWTWLDEKQARVEAIDGDDWAAFVRRARSFAVN